MTLKPNSGNITMLAQKFIVNSNGYVSPCLNAIDPSFRLCHLVSQV